MSFFEESVIKTEFSSGSDTAGQHSASTGPVYIPRMLTNQADRIGQRWQIGNVSITKIVEFEATQDCSGLIPPATPEALRKMRWLQPDFADEDGYARMSIHGLIVETPNRRLIVDTCIGNEKDRIPMPNLHHLQLPFLSDLQAAGYPRESIDTVLCTHLHVDHVGWNTMLLDGKWVPTFPNARYLFSRTEYEHWRRVAGTDAAGFDEVQRLSFIDSVEPVMDAGLVDLVDGVHQVCDEVSLIPTPGHSPGHVSVWISSAEQQALITGDMAHHPCQLTHMDWSTIFDFDPHQASRARETVFNRISDKPVLVIGTHWAGASSGMVIRDGKAFRLKVQRPGLEYHHSP